ncbi:MAG: DUF354 domain-containing protein [bacterium]|nr:DUF354 domain-containing protein [bacterium]
MTDLKLLIDLQHPAHLHFFRPLIRRLREEGHTVRITGRDKDILVQLAGNYGIDIEIFGVARKGVWNLTKELLHRERRLYRIIKKFKPHLVMAISGTYTAFLGRLLKVPVTIFYDTEHATLSNLMAYPFSSCIYVPRCYRKKIRWNHERYNGYHELAYLRPNYFQPDPSVLKEAGVTEAEKIVIVRFVGWAAAHDIGRAGLSGHDKIAAVKQLSSVARVFISSEGELPEPLEPYRLRLDVTRIHHLMAFSSLIFGESATMASEGAVLGVPGVYMDPVGRGYTDEQEKEYGIVFNFTPNRHEDALQKAMDILTDYKKEHWRAIGKRITEEKIDVTEMMHGLVTSYINC